MRYRSDLEPVRRGHKIRIDISFSNFRHFDVKPDSGSPESTGLARNAARNTLFLDKHRASHVILPIVPKRV